MLDARYSVDAPTRPGRTAVPTERKNPRRRRAGSRWHADDPAAAPLPPDRMAVRADNPRLHHEESTGPDRYIETPAYFQSPP